MTAPLCTILHISDLHFGAQPSDSPVVAAEFLRSDVRHQYAEDTSRHLPPECPLRAPDLCVVSGDLTATGREFADAEEFLARICDDLFDGNREKIFVVPGNHDIDWELSANGYREIAYNHELWQQREQPASPYKAVQTRDGMARLFERVESEYAARFRGFQEFFDRFYGGRHPLCLTGPESYLIWPVPDLPQVVLTGFNSCQYVDHLNPVPTVDKEAVVNAGRRLHDDPRYHGAVRVAVWHHGLRPDTHTLDYLDERNVELLSLAGGFSLLLHGHFHRKQYNSAMSVAGRVIPAIGAGTLGAPLRERSESVPYQYNLITIDASQITIHSRKRDTVDQAWHPDFGWGEGGEPFLHVPLPRTPAAHAPAGGSSVHAPARTPAGRGGWPVALVVSENWTARAAAEPELRERARQVIRAAGGGSVGLDDPAFLYGRFDDLQSVLKQVLIQRTNRCILGPQWVGKTAFLQALCSPCIREWVAQAAGLQARLEGVRWVYVDLRENPGTPAETRILEELSQATGLSERASQLAGILRHLEERGERLVVLLDNFEDVLRRNEVEAVFLNELKARQGEMNVIYSMTSEERVPRAGREKAHYFFASAHILDFFNSADTSRALVETTLRIAGIEPPPGAVDRLLHLGGRHPFFLSLARQSFLEAVERVPGEEPAHILNEAVRYFNRLVPRLYDGLLSSLTNFHHRHLTRIMKDQERTGGSVPVELVPFIYERLDGSVLPFSEHFRSYYLEQYLAARSTDES